MNEKTILGLRVLGISLTIGLLTDLLLRATPWGINVFILMSAIAILLYWLATHWHNDISEDRKWLLWPALFFAGCFAWRDSNTLNTLSALAIFGIFSLMILRKQSGFLRLAGTAEYLLSPLLASLNSWFGAFWLFIADIEWKTIPRGRWTEQAAKILRGLLLAIPLILIFGALLMSADAVFESGINHIFHFNFENTIFHIIIISFFSWLAAGFLRAYTQGNNFPIPQERPVGFAIGMVETVIALGLLDLLFLSFVAVQIKFLFGGAALAQITPGLTYSAYARNGFFELVWVVALVLPVLLIADWLFRKESNLHVQTFRWLAGITIVLLFVIMASAIVRMRVYQDGYGLTELRFYTMVFMGWLAMVFVWFAITVLRGERRYFAFGAFVSGLMMIAMLQFFNPDAYIARINIARSQAAKTFDPNYLSSLSDDAVPDLVKSLPAMPTKDRNDLAKLLEWRIKYSGPTDWRSWNYSRRHARQTVLLYSEEIQQYSQENRTAQQTQQGAH